MRPSGGNWCWFPILELLSEYLDKNSDDTDFDQTDTYKYDQKLWDQTNY